VNPTHSSGAPGPLDLASAYAKLQRLVLEGLDVSESLRHVAELARAIVPGTRCGILMRRPGHVLSVMSRDDSTTDQMLDVQRDGPCLEAMRTARRVDAPDLASDDRWGDYASRARACGVRSIVSLPMVVDDDTAGALNLFSPSPYGFSEAEAEAEVDRARAFAEQATTTVTILLRESSRFTLSDQLNEALVTRAVIDQAVGVLMHAHHISGRDAFEILRRASQSSNRRVSVIAADLIEAMTGHPPEPPLPLTDRRPAGEGGTVREPRRSR
jgi:GAF domain-containing protein